MDRVAYHCQSTLHYQNVEFTVLGFTQLQVSMSDSTRPSGRQINFRWSGEEPKGALDTELSAQPVRSSLPW